MIGDGLQRKPPEPRYVDPEEVLAGRCLTCRQLVSCLRKNARTPADDRRQGASVGLAFNGLGIWGDVPATECPNCHARVFVMPVAEFRKVLG